MILVTVALILSCFALFARTVWCDAECDLVSKWFMGPLLLSLLADLFAGVGFFQLISTPPNTGADYSGVLTILSLLAAGVIAGNFSFTHQETAHDEVVLVGILSALMLVLFYSIFGAVSYYSGLSVAVSCTPNVEYIIPTIMTLVLWSNTVNDFWDFREGASCKTQISRNR